MKSILTLILGLGLSFGTVAADTWSLGEVQVKGRPVVIKFVEGLPSLDVRRAAPWLTVVSWNYDGSKSNGMPPRDINALMIQLEDGMEGMEGRGKLFFDAYSATGNNLKEFVFYSADRERFMANFNRALKAHPAYPIGITFHEDKEWSELARLQSRFKAGR